MRRLLQASDRERCVRFRDDRAPALFSERGQVATATTARLSRQYRGVVARGVGMGSRLKADGQMPVRQLDEAPKL
jgi:hypothetical protein